MMQKNSGASPKQSALPNRCALVVRGMLTLLAVLWVACCNGSTIETSTDGETHFLRICSPEGDACGPGLTCTCGVCSAPCTAARDCSGMHSRAECVSTVERLSGSCGEAQAEAICDVPCVTDADCGPVASGLSCSSGFCRASTDLDPTDGGNCSEEPVAGSEVVLLGDVFIAQEGTIITELEALARDAGSLGPADSYRNFTSITQNSLSMPGALLLDRYSAAQNEGVVKVVVMNGGGSDLLVRSCDSPPTADCPLMVEVVAGANQLLAQMAADGVEDVVWFYYPDPTDAPLLAELDVLRPLLEAACSDAPLPCHWVDLRPTFDGRYTEFMQSDFVPTAAGAKAAANVLWSTMERECIAQ